MDDVRKKHLSDTLINQIVDTFDVATHLYYHALIDENKDNTAVTNYKYHKAHTNYYECLLMMYDVFMGRKELQNIDDDINKEIEDLFDELEQVLNHNGITNEEMRKALLLLDINGFKNLNFPLDYITPDVIGSICAYVINSIFEEKNQVNILDYNFGVGNLAFNIVNNLEYESKLIGIENHSLLVDVSAHKAEMMMRELDLYHQDALEYLTNDIDIVVSDLANGDYNNDHYHSYLYQEGVRYFPYLAIERYLELPGNPLHIYIIDNDFFSKKGNNLFKKMLKEKGSILSIIALPSAMFLNDENSKSMMILDQTPRDQDSTSIFVLPKPTEKIHFVEVIDSVIKYIKEHYQHH